MLGRLGGGELGARVLAGAPGAVNWVLVRRLLFNLRKHLMTGQSPMDGRIVIASQLYPSDIL